jgi:hypothetical protein
MSQQPPPPQYSPDGKFWWNGQAWVPVQAPAVPIARQGHALRNVAIGCGGLIGVLIVLGIIGSLANGGNSSKSTPTPTSTATPTSKASAAFVAPGLPTRDGSCSPQPCANDNYGWIVNVSNVRYGVDTGNQFEHPEAGNVYVTLDLTFTNKTNKSQSANPLYFKLIDGNGVKHDITSITTCQVWSAVDIAAGGSYGPKCTAFEAVAGKPAGLVLDWTPSLIGGNYKMKLT